MTHTEAHSLFIRETLQLAGAELKRRFGKTLNISTKPDKSIVTDADLASERIIIDRIRKAFPKDHIYSEESGQSSTKRPVGDRVWVIDPLDGTSNFANRYPFFCVSVGSGTYRADGTVQIDVGGIIDPMRDALYWAQRGGGAYCNDTAIHVGKTVDLSRAFMVTGFYYQKGAALEAEIRRFAKIAEICSTVRRDGAAALDMALVAAGVYDGFWERGLQPWDIAAGSIIIKEAGGQVGNYDLTKPFSIEADGLICGNAAMVQAMSSQIF